MFKKIGSEIFKNKGIIFICFVSLFLLVPSIFAAPNKPEVKKEKVLGVSEVPKPSPSPSISPTPTPVPTSVPSPTPTPSPSASTTPTLTPTSSANSNPTPTPTPVPTSVPSPTPTPSPSPSPTPATSSIEVAIDYAGQKAADSYPASVQPGKTAWDALLSISGLSVEYETYDWGIFIKGFNGVSAASNQFYEFKVNGGFSSVGVSDYTVSDGDQLDFILTTF